jgi:putative MATE family efflux protein
MTINENTNPMKLAWPIFIELLLFMIMGNIDTLMLSRYSDLAVAAVGNANQILNTLLILFNITSAATGIMVTQYIGASKREQLNQIYTLAFLVNIFLAVVIAMPLFFFQTAFFKLIQMPEALYEGAASYLNVSLNFLFVPAILTMASTVLKSNGKTKVTMTLAILMNLINLGGNYLSLFGPFHWGISGVAASTVISRAFAAGVLIFLMYHDLGASISLKNLLPFPRKLARQFFKVGIPSAGEPISYQFSQMVIFTFVNVLGTVAITTRIYVQILVWFTYLASMAIAQANQIVMGHLVGAGKHDFGYRMTLKSLRQSLIVTISMSLLFMAFRYPLMHIFTNDEAIVSMGATLLMIDIFVEVGRVFNLVLIYALKASGDVNFPVVVGLFSMWIVSTGGAYLLGIHFGMGLIGIWIAAGADEMLRGFIMRIRIGRGAWRKKSLVEA